MLELDGKQGPPNHLKPEEIVRIAQRIAKKWKMLACLTSQFETYEIDNLVSSGSNEDEIDKAFNMLSRYVERGGTRQKLVDALKELQITLLAQKVLSGSFINH